MRSQRHLRALKGLDSSGDSHVPAGAIDWAGTWPSGSTQKGAPADAPLTYAGVTFTPATVEDPTGTITVTGTATADFTATLEVFYTLDGGNLVREIRTFDVADESTQNAIATLLGSVADLMDEPEQSDVTTNVATIGLASSGVINGLRVTAPAV